MSTREQIANRIREEHEKHPALDWADIASAKILSAMREEAQPSAPTVDHTVQVVTEWCMHWCERVAPDDSDWEDLRARLTKLLTKP